MSTIVNLYRIIVHTRIMIFLFILLLFLDALILFYYPQYKTEQDIQSQKRSIAKYLNITSEIIADKSDTNTLSNDQIISYLKYNSDIIYIIIPDSNASVIFPSGFIAVEQISSLRFNEIIELNGQNLVNIRIIPPLKYHFEFKEIFLGINAREILENKNEYYNFAFIVIAISFILLCIFIALYILDFYKFQNKVKSDHLKLDNLNISEDNILHENGILQLKSRLIHRKRELKSINNILAATITSQRNFIKVISHDLKAPLRNVSGLVDSIFRKFSDKLNPDVANRLSRIKNNVDKERDMISDILKNITNQKQILKYEKVDINEVVLSIIEDLHFDIQDKNIEINIKTKLPPIYSNRIILKHVFQNLLDNACKYFPKQGNNKIDILYSDNNSNYVFSIKDTGPGMSKELQKKLFNPSDFNQAVNTVEDVDSGLGLELVRTFIEIINGKIWLESEVGEGSTFFISLNKLDDTKAGIFE